MVEGFFFVHHLIDCQGECKGNEYRTRREEHRHNRLGGRGDWNENEPKAVKKKAHEVNKGSTILLAEGRGPMASDFSSIDSQSVMASVFDLG